VGHAIDYSVFHDHAPDGLMDDVYAVNMGDFPRDELDHRRPEERPTCAIYLLLQPNKGHQVDTFPHVRNMPIGRLVRRAMNAANGQILTWLVSDESSWQ
jgi:hypothetical protein